GRLAAGRRMSSRRLRPRDHPARWPRTPPASRCCLSRASGTASLPTPLLCNALGAIRPGLPVVGVADRPRQRPHGPPYRVRGPGPFERRPLGQVFVGAGVLAVDAGAVRVMARAVRAPHCIVLLVDAADPLDVL